jgi:TolA-binding protein
MHRLIFVSALAAMLAFPALAFALDAEEAGTISAEIEDRENAVRAEYGNRHIRDMSREERKEMEAKIEAAREEVLDKHGTTEKDYDKSSLKVGREGAKAMDAAKKDRAAKIAEEKKAAEKKPGEATPAQGEVKVQKGFSDKNPVVTDQAGDQVQRGAGNEGIEIPVPSGN